MKSLYIAVLFLILGVVGRMDYETACVTETESKNTVLVRAADEQLVSGWIAQGQQQ